ncbi:MAG: hypothetical protein R2762_11950 [Bryobacteraceae bacterium]
MQIRPDPQNSRLILLAPAGSANPGFGYCAQDAQRHDDVIASIQRFRGEIYVAEGAIRESELTPDGRHWQAEDARSWHVVSTDNAGNIIGCTRYRFFHQEPRFEDLSIGRSELARSPIWMGRLWKSIQMGFQEASQRGVCLGEVGGWAVAEPYRCRAEALRLALCTFGLARLLGGCIAFTTATVRHCSASILRRLGGRSLEVDGVEIPRYFDPRYDCDMEVLRFDSTQPNPRYAGVLDLLCEDLSANRIIVGAPAAVPVGIALPDPRPTANIPLARAS